MSTIVSSDYSPTNPSTLQYPWVFMDAGDTFIYGYPTFYQALRDCCMKQGLSISIVETEKVVKDFLATHPPVHLIDQESFTRFFHELYRDVLSALHYPGDLEKAVVALWEEWETGHRFRLFDDALSALRRLRNRGFRMGVISNWDQTFHSVLKQLGVTDFFDFTVASVQVGLSKPDPQIFHYALEQTGAQAACSWYLGDQIEADIQPAAALGFKTIYVDYYSKGGANGFAHYTVPSMSVAAEIICTTENR